MFTKNTWIKLRMWLQSLLIFPSEIIRYLTCIFIHTYEKVVLLLSSLCKTSMKICVSRTHWHLLSTILGFARQLQIFSILESVFLLEVPSTHSKKLSNLLHQKMFYLLGSSLKKCRFDLTEIGNQRIVFVGVLFASDGNSSHAVTIHGSLIYDANEVVALPLC